MLQAMLNRHPMIEIQGETHYFDDLRQKMAGRERAPLDDDARKQCEDYFLALEHRPYGHGGDPEQSPLARAVLRARAEAVGEGADAYFEASCRLRAEGAHAPRWGEKTPRHVFRLREILSRFDDAKAICMVRDARAVVASYRDWKNQGGFDLEKDPGHAKTLEAEQKRARKSYHILIASMLWRGTVRAALAARDEFGSERVRIQKYEDVVLRPNETVPDLAQWLGVPFDESMMDAPVRNSSYEQFDAKGGFSEEAVNRWRKKLSAQEISVIQRACRKELLGAGYALEDAGAHFPAYAWALATLPFAGVRAVLANRERINNLPAYIWRRLGPGR
jgi:hypothetical protein